MSLIKYSGDHGAAGCPSNELLEKFSNHFITKLKAEIFNKIEIKNRN